LISRERYYSSKYPTPHNLQDGAIWYVHRNLEMDMTTAPTEDAVLSAAETAELLGVSEFTLLRKRQRPNADGLPYIRLSPKRIG
jgi:hypothetical protein